MYTEEQEIELPEQEELVTIEKSKFIELIKNQKFLRALQNGGVDNWVWYGECIDNYIEEENYNDDEEKYKYLLKL